MNLRISLTLCLTLSLCAAGCGPQDSATDRDTSAPRVTQSPETDATVSPEETPQDTASEEPTSQTPSEPEEAGEAVEEMSADSQAKQTPEPAAETQDSTAATTPDTPSADPDASWPQFHGPNADNKSTETGLLTSWPDDGPPLVWDVTGIGNGYSSVSIANGLIYTVGNQDGKTMISAINLDGNLQWQVANGPAYTEDYPGTRGTPTIDGERLYHQSPVGNIVCMKAADGAEIWTVNSLERFHAKNIKWALAESLLIDGNHVITCPGGDEVSVAALDKTTGETVWAAESAGDQTSYATPTLAECNGVRIIFTMTAKALIGVDADKGKLLFRYPFETKYDINALQPIYHEGHVFISGGYGTTGSDLLKVIVEGDKVSVEQVWRSKDLDNQHGGVVLLDGYLYGAAHSFNGGRWICLDWKTGELQWAERGVGKGSLTYADGMLYTMSEKRMVGLAKATPEKFELVSKFRIPSGGTGATWAHPVVCGGRLYIRHDDTLFVYNVKAG
jgi:outer membrane protein assembly factor BamB